jgi:uncharacterized lipoprotein
MRSNTAVLVLAIGIAASGCALTTDKIDLQYAVKPGATTLPGANEVSVAVQVSDQRADKSKVGTKKNGYGMEMAPIVPAEDITATIRRAIESELFARGFKLGPDAVVQIAADVTRFYNDFKMGFFAGDAVADLNMTATVRSRKGEVLYTRQVVVQGQEPNTMLASGDNAKIGLTRALENGMKLLFEDQAFLGALLGATKEVRP